MNEEKKNILGQFTLSDERKMIRLFPLWYLFIDIYFVQLLDKNTYSLMFIQCTLKFNFLALFPWVYVCWNVSFTKKYGVLYSNNHFYLHVYKL